MTLTVAIISDIHANLEALTAVLFDISAHDVRRIYCLGDIVGYGPNPCECIDIAMTFSVCPMGNHDKLAVEGKADSPAAQWFLLWTRKQLATATEDPNVADGRRDFLRNLPLTHSEDGVLYVHGGPRDPLNEYLFPELVFDQRKMASVFAMIDHGCFMGHTHLPGIFTPDWEFLTPEQIGGQWRIASGARFMCNVGSVGQPRDGDDRACYCLYDGDSIQFRRVDYDVDATSRKLGRLFPPE